MRNSTISFQKSAKLIHFSTINPNFFSPMSYSYKNLIFNMNRWIKVWDHFIFDKNKILSPVFISKISKLGLCVLLIDRNWVYYWDYYSFMRKKNP